MILVDPALPPVRGADSYPVSAHGHVLPGDGGSHRDNEEGGEGALQGAQVQDGHILQVGRALPHQAPQH